MRVPGMIGTTGQSPRALVSLCLVLVGAGLPWFIAKLGLADDAEFLLDLVSALLAIGGVVLGCRGIRCPSCGCKWILWAMRTQPFQSWLDAVVFSDTCPKCSTSYSKSNNVAA